MSEDYLWDRSGEPDEQIEHLEGLLGRYRHTPRALDDERVRRRRRVPPWKFLALAACLLLVVKFWPPAGYRLHRGEDGERVELARVGELVQLDADSAWLEIAELGRVEFEPHSVFRVDRASDTLHALYLDSGSLHATIVAEPRRFQVGTLAGISIDLGCEYDLAIVDDSGTVRLSVQTGQVAFAFGEREVYVPAGATCFATVADGPGAPMFDDIDPELRVLIEALARGESSKSGPLETLAAIDALISAHTDYRADYLPLFALATDERLTLELREALFDQLSEVFQRPAGVTRTGFVSGDSAMREAWLETISSWWKRK